MTDRELLQQALDALESECDATKFGAAEALRARLEQNDFNPDWDAMAVMVEEQQRMAKRIEELEARLAQPDLITPADVEQLARIEKLIDKIDPYEAQPEPEPVAWMHDSHVGFNVPPLHRPTTFY